MIKAVHCFLSSYHHLSHFPTLLTPALSCRWRPWCQLPGIYPPIPSPTPPIPTNRCLTCPLLPSKQIMIPHSSLSTPPLQLQHFSLLIPQEWLDSVLGGLPPTCLGHPTEQLDSVLGGSSPTLGHHLTKRAPQCWWASLFGAPLRIRWYRLVFVLILLVPAHPT